MHQLAVLFLIPDGYKIVLYPFQVNSHNPMSDVVGDARRTNNN